MLPNINTCMRKWMVEFLSKSQSRVIKIAWVNSIQFTLISYICAIPRDDVIESTRFLMRPHVIIPQCVKQTQKIRRISNYFELEMLHCFILSKYLNGILYLVKRNIRYLEYDLIILTEYWYSQYSGYYEAYKHVKRFIFMIFVILSSG